MSTQFDVAVIGAGPAGSVASALLRKVRNRFTWCFSTLENRSL
ncbi:NAD(P)-binding protein [Neisseria meningitidis]